MRTPPLARRVNTTHPYTPAVATDIRKTFARARRKLAARDATQPPQAEAPSEGWHAPGLGEVHSPDHKQMIYCEAEDANGEMVASDDLARRVRAALSTPPAPGQVERINLSTFAWGVTRMGDNPKAVLVSFRSEPTDDDLRALHEALRPASGRTVHANAAQAGQVEWDREDAELLRRALYYLEADAADRYGIQGLEEMVRAGDHPVVADLRKRLGGSARFPDAARSSEGGSND